MLTTASKTVRQGFDSSHVCQNSVIMLKYRNDEVFIENSTYPRKDIKKRIIDQQLIPYICVECGNDGNHNGKPLVLQLDHMNGKAEDNRIENLRFLCPNCHSQTATYAGKASTGKRVKIKKPRQINSYEQKLESDRLIWKTLKSDDSIKFGEWGWKSRLYSKLGITSQKVTPWLRRVDPDFLKQYD